MKKLLLTFLIAFITALGLNAKDYYTVLFGKDYNSKSVQTYDDSWYVTYNGTRWDLANFNNNQNGWSYVKCGSKKNASVATITSYAALPEKISSVTVTIDAITTSNVNSISLTVADDAQFETNAATYTAATLAKGDLPFTIDKPAANKFYKLTFDCKKSSSNGVIQISKVVFSGNDDLPTSCEAPNFNFEENAEVTTGDVIKATCTTDNSTVFLKVGEGEFVQTDSYTITKSLATGPLKFEAYATVQGKDGIIESDHKILNVNVVKKLGDIRYNGEAVPATISLKGGEKLTFTSANAVSMTLVVNGDEANKITTLDTGEISWTAPAATEAADQTYALSITSKLDDAVKTANTTVTVAKKPTVETFELLTDLSDVNEENTYILYGVTTANNGVMSKNLNSKDAFDGLSTYTLKDGVITIPADATDVAIITLESDNSGNEVKYYLKTQDNKYIQTTDKASSLKDTKSEATPFSISVRDAEKHTISIYGGGAYFSYNGTNVNRFRGYSGHQSPTYLYVKRAAQVAPEAPTFTPDGGDVDLFSTVKIACASEGATLTYKIGDGEAKAYPADGIKMTEAGEVTITAIATKNGLSTETIKTFNVTDNREEVYVMFDANKYEFTVGEEFESPVAKACTLENEDFVEIPNFTGTIIYESDNTNVAEVNATTGALTLKAAGTCKITASLESETYKSDPDHYTLTVNKGLVDGLIEYPVPEFVYTIGSGEQLPVLYKYPDNVDVEYSISHKRVENGVAVYHPATIDEQGNITVNTPGIVTVTATVKANPTETSSYVLEIQSLKEAEIASTVKAPVVHITGGNVYYSTEGEWYWGTEDKSHELSFANETDGADIYYIKSSATPSSANVRAMANSETGTLYSTPFKKSDLDGKKITFWAEKDGQKSAVETLNFNIKTGIEDIDVENAEAIEEEGDARYFNLQGLEVKNPGEGIYIRVANGKATKILKK